MNRQFTRLNRRFSLAAMETAIEKACRLVGGQSEMARLVTGAGEKVSPQAVHKWIKSGRTPPDKAPIIERITKGAVTAEILCPDFPWPNRKIHCGKAA